MTIIDMIVVPTQLSPEIVAPVSIVEKEPKRDQVRYVETVYVLVDFVVEVVHRLPRLSN